MAVDKRINYRDAGYVSQAYGSRSRSSAPTKSSPFSGNESRQQYSAKQTMTGAVKGGGPRGPDKKFTTSFVDPERGRDSREEFIRNVQKTNPGFTGGPNNKRTAKQFVSGIFNAINKGITVCSGDIIGILNSAIGKYDKIIHANFLINV